MCSCRNMREEFMNDLQIDCRGKRICKPCQNPCPKKCKELLCDRCEKQIRDHCKPCPKKCKKKRDLCDCGHKKCCDFHHNCSQPIFSRQAFNCFNMNDW